MDAVALAIHKTRRLRTRLGHARENGGHRAVVALVLLVLRQALLRVVVGIADEIVDRRYGIRTAGVLHNEHMLRERTEHADANYYQPIARRGFAQLLAAADVDPALTSFVDLGAGRGRALVFAAEHGFRTVVGVELDPALAEQARSNVARWEAGRGRRAVRPVTFDVRTEDATAVELPPGPVLVFVYNSFGADTLRIVLNRLVASYDEDRRPITLCYFNPVHVEVLENSARLRITARTQYWAVGVVEGLGP
jgi:SAM-dependent methyltransferase